jgi:hypothetical protein
MNELVTSTLIELVTEMREAQVEYFSTRDKEVLMRAKRMENKVDSFIRSIDKKEKGAGT